MPAPLPTIAITGATGFVGKHLTARLTSIGHPVIPVVRKHAHLADEVIIEQIDGSTDWQPLLSQGVDQVVHLAAHVHMMKRESAESRQAFYQVNLDGTVNFSRQCAAAGVRRFVFISTVKVMGEGDTRAYQTFQAPQPEGAYAASKWAAEQQLIELCNQCDMELVILRPPLIYGPGVGANFLSLINLVKRGIPLPLGAINNQRSLLYVGNFVSAITAALNHPNAAGQTFFVNDMHDLSTPELIGLIARELHRSPALVAVPPDLIRFAGSLLGQRKRVDRLLGSLTSDASPLNTQLAWEPPYSVAEGIQATVHWYLNGDTPQ